MPHTAKLTSTAIRIVSSPASGAGAAGSGSTCSISQLLSKLSPSNLASAGIDSLVKNPLGVALGIGGLGYNILQGQKQTANEKALTADAQTATANSNNMVASGEALQQY
jgi:hypothetical protein